jgi:hypothetical protein
MIVPRPGLALIRRIKAAQTMPGGRILLTENTRDFLTAGQAEIVTIGTAGEPDEDAEGQVYDELSHLASGANRTSSSSVTRTSWRCYRADISLVVLRYRVAVFDRGSQTR